MQELTVIGGGLAGCEAAWQAAERGVSVRLYEMRPAVPTGAHITPHLAELVCSNSLGSKLPDRASGLLKEELRRLGSMLLACAELASVPAGGALAVDRAEFSRQVTARIDAHPGIQVIRQEVQELPPGPTIIASGPLTSPALSDALARLTGAEHLYFFDAIAPIVRIDSINLEIAYPASRYEKGGEVVGDYLNCPMDRTQYENFVDELVAAQRIELKAFEFVLESGVSAGAEQFFEGCLPLEILARRGRQSLSFGPLRPVGLVDSRSGRWPYAVVQLRQDNLARTLFNLVGFQTNLTFSEQKRVFRLIPGLENAEFERYGQMHRNTFIFSPACLEASLQFARRPDVFFAGQIMGVEGYTGNIATGLLAGINAARHLAGLPVAFLPPTTMLGALVYYATHASAADYQPMKANFGLLPELENFPARSGRRQRAQAHAQRALSDLDAWLADQQIASTFV